MNPEALLAEKKRSIFESTLELVRENGFHGTPMSLVARKAGVAAGTIYHYFDSKDTLIIELYGYIRSQMFRAMLDGDDETRDYQSRFFTFWQKHYRFYIQNPNALYFIEQFVNSPYYDRCPEKENDRCQQIMSGFLRSGIESGLLKQMDLKLMSILVHSNVITAAKIYLAKKVKLSEKELQQVAQLAWDGIVNRQTF